MCHDMVAHEIVHSFMEVRSQLKPRSGIFAIPQPSVCEGAPVFHCKQAITISNQHKILCTRSHICTLRSTEAPFDSIASTKTGVRHHTHTHLCSKEGQDATACTNIHNSFALEVQFVAVDSLVVDACPHIILASREQSHGLTRTCNLLIALW